MENRGFLADTGLALYQCPKCLRATIESAIYPPKCCHYEPGDQRGAVREAARETVRGYMERLNVAGLLLYHEPRESEPCFNCGAPRDKQGINTPCDICGFVEGV